MRRTILLLLALGWGWLVYGMHQSIGYEKATGDPSVASCLGLAALPLLLGAFMLDSRDETLKYQRWFCIAWLFVQGIFLLIFSWLNIFGLIPLLGIALILWPEQTVNKHPIQYYTNHKITLLLVAGLLYWWHYNPLPSDEEMIAHFHEHRTEIEELVKRYREWKPSAESPIWEDLPGNKPLMIKARVKRVTDVAPDWPPNPYSIEAAKQFSKLLQAGKIPSLNPYSSIAVELLDEDDPERHFARVLTASGRRLIFKELIFIPEVVRIEDEILWLPAHPFTGVTGKMRIYKTLDEYPSNWIKGTCVYRQFETHWFLHLCAAAV